VSRDSSGSSSGGGGLGLPAVLGVVFVVLKLVGVIGWSWWWVLAPFWGSFALGLVVLALLALVAAAAGGGRR